MTKEILNKRVLGVFSLTMINVAAIQSLRNLPVMAGEGWTMIFFYFAAAAGFFVPCSLVAAELATGWPSRGGIYTWVKEAFGPRWGFVAIWLQWIENVVWYPTVLSFTAATIAYLISPELVENRVYIITMILTVYWLCTLVDALGMKISAIVSSVGVIFGTLLPAALIIALGAWWVLSGEPSHIPFSREALFPDISDIGNIVFLVGVVLAFAGMEMSAVHAKEVENPQKNYPKAIFFSMLIILGVSILGSLAIAVVIPRDEISLVAGVMQAFAHFFEAYEIPWMTRVVAGLIAAGAIAMVSTWIVGPSKGLFQTAHEGHIPPIFHKRNRYGMPYAILIAQGCFVTLLCSAFFFMPTVNSSYWILNDLAALLYLVMYMLMFSSAIKLRHSRADTKRHYRIPGGKYAGMWLVAGIGLACSIFSFCIGFVLPTRLETGEVIRFEIFLGMGVLAMVVAPLVIYALQRPHWMIDIQREEKNAGDD